MRVDLTVVAMFDGEHNVHSATFEDILIKSQIPRSHLPHMQNVLRDLIFRHGFLHDVLQGPHLVRWIFVISALHVATLD